MKSFLLSWICLAFCTAAFAQSGNRISGTILDQQSVALPFATVLVLHSKDSSVVKGTITDEAGQFVLEQIPDKDYLLSVSMVGYQTFYSPRFELNALNSPLKWPTIRLQPTTTQLKGVTVTAQKPFIEQQIDKTILNVENSLVASGNTALEVLEKAPGVSVDHQNDQIKLNNKNGVLVMIDGKRSFLSNQDLTNLLRTMSSDQIATIELITNPSSKYDASGNAGIIHIKLKKNQALGTNGGFSSSVSNGFIPDAPNDLVRPSFNFNLNHRAEKWNVYGNVGGFRKSDYNEIRLQRTIHYEGIHSAFNQRFNTIRRGAGLSGKLGFDYFASPKTTLGVMLDGATWKTQINAFSQATITEVQQEADSVSSFVQRSGAEMPIHTFTANFNIKHEFEKKGSELTFDADYSGFGNNIQQYFDADFRDEEQVLQRTTNQRNSTRTRIAIYAAKVDFTLLLPTNAKLETGLKSSYVTTGNTFDFEQREGNDWKDDSSKSNQFIYQENVNAAYASLGKQWKKWHLQAGLRAEHTHSNGHSVTDQKVVIRNYLSLFPTFFLNHTITQNNSIRYSYSRRIDRPGYRQLNPFKFYMDPFTIDEGNPFLRPQFTDNFEVTYTYRNASSLALGYSNTHDYIVQFTEQNDSSRIVKAINGNLGHFKNYSANLSFPLTVKSWWTMQNKVGLYYQQYSDSDLLGGQFSSSQLAYNINTSSSFTLPNDWTAEVSVWYNSPNAFGVERSLKPQYAVNAGIQKSFPDKRWKIKLSVNDLFYTSRYNGEVKYQNVDLAVQSRWTSRRVALTGSYTFGNQHVKAVKRRGTATEDLKNRTGAE